LTAQEGDMMIGGALTSFMLLYDAYRSFTAHSLYIIYVRN